MIKSNHHIYLSCFLLLFVSVIVVGCTNDSKKKNPYVGDMYDTSYAGQVTPSGTKYRINAAGEEIAIDRNAGKFIWTDFAAPWCPPCTPQAQVIKRLENVYPDTVVFMTVMTSKSAKYRDIPDQQTARAWASRFGLNPENVVSATDLWGRVVPTHFLYSPEGHTLYEYKGGMSEAQIREVLARYIPEWQAWDRVGTRAEWMSH